MNRNLLRVITGASALVITGGVLAATVGTAAAAGTTPWEPDSINELGTLQLFDSSGNVVSGGSNLAHPFDYALASSAETNSGTKAFIEYAQPQPGSDSNNPSSGTINPGGWPTSSPTSAVAFPVSTPASLASQTNPVATVATTDANGSLQTFIAGTTAQSGALANIYQIRLYTSGIGSVGSSKLHPPKYWAADVLVNPSAGTWSQIYPTVVTPTHTTVSSTSPSLTGAAVTFTAHVTPTGTAGSVDFTDTTTSTDFGNGTYNASTGVATISHTFTAVTAGDTITATFTPSDTTDFSGSSGTTTQVVNAPSTPTKTTLTVNQDGTAGDDVGLSSTVTTTGSSPSPVTAGTVSWYDNGSTTALNSSPVTPNASGVATLDIPSGLTAGSHSIVAVFTPTNTANFEVSQSPAQQFSLNTAGGACAAEGTTSGSSCTDQQFIEATVPIGTLVINTPYTQSNPLNLGTLALNAADTEYQATANFNNINITDLRSGGLGWTASAESSTLSDGGSHPGSTINSQNVGLTGLTFTQSAGDTGVVTVTPNPAADPALAPTVTTGSQGLGNLAHVFATQTVATGQNGDGNVNMNGLLSLNAPTSTEAGTFTGTITFTVG